MQSLSKHLGQQNTAEKISWLLKESLYIWFEKYFLSKKLHLDSYIPLCIFVIIFFNSNKLIIQNILKKNDEKCT